MNAIIDADSLCFRTAAASENEDLFIAAARLDESINRCLDEVSAKEQVLFLSGKNNFRYEIYPEYKGNRKGKPRPKWEQALKQHVIDQWDAIVVDGMEGDDGCGIAQYASIAEGDDTIIIHQDKDLNQLAGWHYNFVKKEKYHVSEEEGIRFFYYQLLVGDNGTDNIKGAVGIGPKKAEGLLLDQPLTQLYSIVREVYNDDEELNINATCLWILRHKDKTWKDYLISEASIS